MRFTIILALCAVGVVSASSLNKRSFLDDIQNNTQNAFKAFEQFGQSFNDKLQEALKNLFDAFGNKKESEDSVSVSKRATNPFELINAIGDPAKMAQTFLQLLGDMALGQGRRKRDIQENIQKFAEEAKKKAEEALKKLFDLFESLKPQTEATTEAVVVEKRATNALQLINDLGDPAKFAQTLVKVLADMALGQGRRKRDVAEDFKKFTEAAKHNAEQGVAKLMEFLEQLKAQFNHDKTEAEKVVSKRDIQETLEKFNKLAQTKAQEAFEHIRQTLDQLIKGNPFFQSISNQFNNNEDSTEAY